jgi:hypothetical protein
MRRVDRERVGRVALGRLGGVGKPLDEAVQPQDSERPQRLEAAGDALIRDFGCWVDGGPCRRAGLGATDQGRHDPLPSTFQQRDQPHSLMSPGAMGTPEVI